MKFWKKEPEHHDNHFELNPILEKIGHFGKFQYLQILLFWTICINTGIGVYSFAFTGFLPDYRCIVPQCEDIETATYYGKSITYQDTWDEDDLTFADFVQEAVKGLDAGQHECKRVTFEEPSDSCDAFKQKLASNQTRLHLVRKTI